MNKENMPEIKIGVVAVSRDCFPESLSVNRRKALMDAYTKKYGKDHIYECPICIVESEIHMVQALEDVKAAGCDALVVSPAILDRRSPRHCWQSILTDRKCLLLRRKNPGTVCWMAEGMLTVEC